MTADDRRHLNQILDQSRAGRRYYLKQIAIHSALVTTAGSYTRPELANGRRGQDGELLSIQTDNERPVPSRSPGSSLFSHQQNRLSRRFALSWAAVAAILCLIASIALWTDRRNTHRDTSIASKIDAGPTIALAPPESQRFVAEVTYLSQTVRWRD